MAGACKRILGVLSRSVLSRSVLSRSVLVLASVSGCNQDDAFIMSQMHRVAADEQATDAQPGPAGHSCANVAGGSGATGSAGSGEANDFWMQEESSSSGLTVTIGSFDQVLESRFYDRTFIAAHEVDRFLVTTRSGDEYVFTYWGGDTCERCPPVAFEALPGDPWGCGTQAPEPGNTEPGSPVVDG